MADVTKFDMIKTARPGATFLLNTPWVGQAVVIATRVLLDHLLIAS